jgi:DNA-directed RNA polymerase subunit M/transcription elongation factor TFIIS
LVHSDPWFGLGVLPRINPNALEDEGPPTERMLNQAPVCKQRGCNTVAVKARKLDVDDVAFWYCERCGCRVSEVR